MSWTRSSFCGNGACVEVAWTRSSFCAGGDCVDACRQGQIVLVRDSAGTVQAWSAREWASLLRLIKGEWTPDGVCELVDDCIELGLDHHDDKLNYTGEEWDAFKKGVVDEQFEIDKLREFKSSSSAVGVVEEERAGAAVRGGAPTQTAAAGAERSSSPPVPVAAPLSEARFRALIESGDILGAQKAIFAHLNDVQANHAAAGAGITGRDTPASVVAHMRCPTCDSPEPRLHPAVQFEGEVIPCADLWHRPSDVPAGLEGAARADGQPGLTNLERVRAIVLTQIRLGGSKTEIAEAIVADLQKGGLIVADPAVETQETGSIAYDAPCDCHDCAAGQEHDPDGASCLGQ